MTEFICYMIVANDYILNFELHKTNSIYNMKFCSVCENLLQKSTLNGILQYKCMKCYHVEEHINPVDTILFTSRKINTIEDTKHYPNLALQQSTMKYPQPCIKCDEKITTAIYHDDCKLLFVCKCGAYFNIAAVDTK